MFTNTKTPYFHACLLFTFVDAAFSDQELFLYNKGNLHLDSIIFYIPIHVHKFLMHQ